MRNNKIKARTLLAQEMHNIKGKSANCRQVEIAPKFIEKANRAGDGQRGQGTDTAGDSGDRKEVTDMII